MYEINRNMNEGLHVLRGLAAVSVIFYHAAHMPPYSDVGALSVFHEFGAGVTLFFLLSGFSLTLSNIDKTETPGWIRSYTLKRFFRIAPLWWFMIAVTVGFHYLEYGKIYSIGEVARNAFPIFGLTPGYHESFVWAGWTIGVEVIFYAIFPLLLATLGRSLLKWSGITILAGVISVTFVASLPDGTSESYKYMAFTRQFVVFCIGALLFLAIDRVPEAAVKKVRQVGLLVAGALLYAWAIQHNSPGQNLIGDPVVFKALALGALVIVFYSAKSMLYNPLTKFWGDASYGVYLIHPIIVHETKFVYAWLAERISSPEATFLLYVSFVILIVSVLAKIVHSAIEEPLYKYGRKVANTQGAASHSSMQEKAATLPAFRAE